MKQIGDKIGRLTIVGEAPDTFSQSGRRYKRLYCDCDCGNKGVIIGKGNLGYSTFSCGCLARELSSQRERRYNQYDLSGEYGIGYTNKGEKFYFDLEDYDLIKVHCWRLHPSGYVETNAHAEEKRQGMGKRIFMHWLFMGKYVDHINGNRADNRRINLRKESDGHSFETINNMNKKLQRNNTTGYPGVHWRKDRNIYEVYIGVDKKSIYIGNFKNYEDAVKARKEAELKYFGEYKYDNTKNAI